MASPKLLIVEDEIIIARELEARLKGLGYGVVGIAPSGRDALALIERSAPDLILMDIVLKGDMDGIEAAAEIRRRVSIPIIYLTAYTDEATLRRAKVTEPHGYIVKPFSERELRANIEMALYKHEVEGKQRTIEKWFAASMRRIAEAVTATDKDANITFINPIAELLTGWTREEALGKKAGEVFTFVVRSTQASSINPIFQALSDGVVTEVTGDITLLNRRGEEIPIEYTAACLRDNKGNPTGAVLVIRDLSEQKRAEIALSKTQEQLLQAQKMEAMGQLAAGVAHDFNNVLTVIQGYTEFLIQQARLDERTKKLVMEIQKAGARGAALTRQLLIFSRKEMVEPKVLDLNATVTEMDLMLRRLIGADVALGVTLAQGLERVRADPGHIEQVIVNLVVNARDAMPLGGRLTIETSNVVVDEALGQRHLGVQPGSYVLLAVSDTGCGMTEEVKARLFEPFFTTKEVGKGTGLGLAIVYGIVQQSGGSIVVHSKPGQGTSFRIYLPTAQELPPSHEAPPSAQTGPNGTEVILLVEDEDPVRTFTRLVLESYGYTVLEAHCPEVAIRLCEEHRGTIQLLVTDLVMPQMGGRQLAERLALLQSGIKVLYVSGYTNDTIIRHGILHHDVHFLQKPYSPAALAMKVREVLDQEAPR